ncbi:MAG: hypothetical protein Q9174_000938 [Haloplaca sp. 1 TL-2023]
MLPLNFRPEMLPPDELLAVPSETVLEAPSRASLDLLRRRKLKDGRRRREPWRSLDSEAELGDRGPSCGG